jgi:hypothetical protein
MITIVCIFFYQTNPNITFFVSLLDNMRKICFLLFSIVLVGCLVLCLIGFDEPQRPKHDVTRRIQVMPTRRIKVVPPRRIAAVSDVDLKALVVDLREYSSNPSRDLEEKLFPWWLQQQSDVSPVPDYRENNSTGIVICTGNNHHLLALVALTALRSIGNELPIEVMFSTPTDLSSRNQEELKTLFPEIEIIDLSLTSFNDSYLELRGWEIKPFAVLASRFRHVLLMDADVLFLEKPSILFQNQYYLQTGSLFFYDRPDISSDIAKWIRSLSDDDNRQIPRRTQEAGVVLIDKARVLAGLLSTCKLNDHQERERVTYKHLYGDKDTWWLGFHLVQINYSFIPTLTASIGTRMENNIVCGHILHLDENHQPIWWNGGMFRNRYVSTKDLLQIDAWLEEGHWTLQTYSCLTNNQQTSNRFSKHQQDLIDRYRQATKQFFNIS